MKTFKALARQGSHHKRAKLLKDLRDLEIPPIQEAIFEEEDDFADEEEGDLNKTTNAKTRS